MTVLNHVYKIEVITTHTNAQEAVLNFFYQVTNAGTSGAEELSDAFWTLVEDEWEDLMNDQVAVTSRICININAPTDFHTDGTSHSGTRIGTLLPSGLTTVLRSGYDFPGDRYSYRRFMFGSAGDLDDSSDSNWNAAMKVELAALAALLNNPITLAGGDEFDPVQLKAGWTLGVAPTVNKDLTSFWSYATRPGWLDSREEDYQYLAASS